MIKYLESLSGLSKILNINISHLVKVYEAEKKRLIKHHGKKFATERLKEYLTLGERYALYQQIEPLPYTKSDLEGFPTKLSAFKPYLRGNPKASIMGLSILRHVETLRIAISKDITTVTDSCVPCTIQSAVLKEFITNWAKVRFKELQLSSMKYHTTYKNGPNGPALQTADKDLCAVMNDPVIWSALQTISQLCNDKLPPNDSFKTNDEYRSHSRIAQFPEKSGKTRTIAVIDYWSQRALKPLHKCLMKSLRRLKSDGTFSHNNVGEYAKQKTKEKSFIFCADLSAATDRLPRWLSFSLLEGLISNSDLRSALWTILTERTFCLSWSDETVSYGCGQPMGAYASWPLFALTHHSLAIYCGRHLKGVENYYRLIGDDIIITDETMAQNYISLIEDLGLTINYNKTVTSHSGSDKSCAEVAKQLYLNGEVLTPMTPGLISNLKDPMLTLSTLRVLMERYILPEHFPTATLSFFHGQSPKRYDKVWLLCTNPMNGMALKRVHPFWEEHDETAFTEMYWFVRGRSLCDKAFAVMKELSKLKPPNITSQNVMYDKIYGEEGDCGDGLTTTGTLYNEAILYSSNQLIDDYQYALEEIDLQRVIGSADLLELEYMYNPADPFKDRKDLRVYSQSNLLLETIEVLTDGSILDPTEAFSSYGELLTTGKPGEGGFLHIKADAILGGKHHV